MLRIVKCWGILRYSLILGILQVLLWKGRCCNLWILLSVRLIVVRPKIPSNDNSASAQDFQQLVDQRQESELIITPCGPYSLPLELDQLPGPGTNKRNPKSLRFLKSLLESEY